MGRLDDKVVIVTGGARGQGAAEAQLFVTEGARVLIGDVRDDAGRRLAASLGPAAAHSSARRTSRWRYAAAVDDCATRFGPVTTLVNNAAVIRFASLLDTSREMFMEQVEVNQLGVFLGIRAVAPTLIAAGGGAIVNVSSTGGLKGVAENGAYCATKFAVRGITRVAAIELGPHRVRVNSIHPGMVETDMIAHLPPAVADDFARRTPLGRRGDPAEIARAVMFLISDEASYMTGSEVVVDGGVLA